MARHHAVHSNDCALSASATYPFRSIKGCARNAERMVASGHAFFLPLSASNSQLEGHLGQPLFVTHAETQGRDDPGVGLPLSPTALVHSKGCGRDTRGASKEKESNRNSVNGLIISSFWTSIGRSTCTVTDLERFSLAN